MWQSSDCKTSECVTYSRQDGKLSPTYVDWIYSFPTFRAKIESAITDYRLEKYYQTKGETARSVSESRGQRITQPFCEDVIHQKGVMLLRSKDGSVASMKHVPRFDIDRFGWFRDEKHGQKFCRYSFDDTLDAVFKVSMDGRVLALAGTV
ncbi:uncharacterized protein GGS22DRAFT_170907 [Annulohypoxylon maeteangense]|uniref:uncharacterized protein n=1 Tax=Annulohypoxylon maeteangense TaxID=1927788 RepID=UPI0020088E08|nr:uncharacterized protein GGS22DRAFT_170907 [Annulohypoxylon maeteangense]KAI0881854.1 hypothetical protein GGS22DRAFT_170907 [Annulohypoxylon maeteangense]